MNRWSLALGLARFAWGAGRFCRNVETLPHAIDTVRRRLASRERLLLDNLQRTVFGRRESPYWTLLRAAGCEPGDVERLVLGDGVETALETLRRAGVYVTFDELKGLAPAIRGSQRFEFRPDDFDNPVVTPHLTTSTGGSRGRPTRIIIDLDYLAETAPHWALYFEENGWLSRSLIFVTPHYPGIANRQLRCARIGKVYERWFVTSRGGRRSYGLVGAWIHAVARRASGAPRPTMLAADDLTPVVDELADLVARGTPPCVSAPPTTAARVCATAVRLGRSLAGVGFTLGGEPYTDARRQTIEAAGARGVPFYGSSEASPVGVQCQRPLATDAVHVLTDLYTVTPDRRAVDDGRTVDGLLVTGLLRAGPKILVNTDLGDVGRVERRTCDCLLGQLGYDTHLSHVRSFEKLTGDGATFLRPDLFPLIEETLPRRFGGGVGDWQLVERQDGDGAARYELRVDPAVGAIAEREVVQAFFDGVAALRPAYGFMVEQWRRGRFLEVRRERPHVSARGKIPPVRTLVEDQGRR